MMMITPSSGPLSIWACLKMTAIQQTQQNCLTELPGVTARPCSPMSFSRWSRRLTFGFGVAPALGGGMHYSPSPSDDDK